MEIPRVKGAPNYLALFIMLAAALAMLPLSGTEQGAFIYDISSERIPVASDTKSAAQVACTKTGPRAYPDDSIKNRYLWCMRPSRSAQWVYYVLLCSKGTTYNDNLKRCIIPKPTPAPPVDSCDSNKVSRAFKDDSDDELDVICR